MKEAIQFRPINLLAPHYPIDTRFDMIFCCNMLIYFDPPVQKKIMTRLADYLNEDGFLFLGQSDTMPLKKGFNKVGGQANIHQKIGKGLAREKPPSKRHRKTL